MPIRLPGRRAMIRDPTTGNGSPPIRLTAKLPGVTSPSSSGIGVPTLSAASHPPTDTSRTVTARTDHTRTLAVRGLTTPSTRDSAIAASRGEGCSPDDRQ
jgi:hypothetical protein